MDDCEKHILHDWIIGKINGTQASKIMIESDFVPCDCKDSKEGNIFYSTEKHPYHKWLIGKVKGSQLDTIF